MARFQRGQPSPNPTGRPKGSKSAKNLLRDEFVTDEQLRGVTDKVVQKALEGDMTAAALIFDRCFPKLKPRADVVEEGAVAEAIAEARLRAMKESSPGLSLEQLVAGSYGSEAAVLIASPAAAIAPILTVPTPPPSAVPAKSIRLDLPEPPSPEDGDPYNPL